MNSRTSIKFGTVRKEISVFWLHLRSTKKMYVAIYSRFYVDVNTVCTGPEVLHFERIVIGR